MSKLKHGLNIAIDPGYASDKRNEIWMGRIRTYALAGGLGSVRAGDSDGHAGGDKEGGDDREEMHFVLVLVCIEARGRWLLLVR